MPGAVRDVNATAGSIAEVDKIKAHTNGVFQQCQLTTAWAGRGQGRVSRSGAFMPSGCLWF
ncbi:MAG: hypothetical protein C0518_06265 [Opitutus sp.]|nr:hypothetical protein [Opitutus sp.]